VKITCWLSLGEEMETTFGVDDHSGMNEFAAEENKGDMRQGQGLSNGQSGKPKKERRTRIDRRSGIDRRSADRRGEGTSTDPMNIYLREMGSQKLLSQEEEIALAKMVEEGESRIQYAVLRLTLGITALNDIAESLLRGTLKINTVIRGVSESEPTALQEIRDGFLDQVEAANEIDAARRELFAELRKCGGNTAEEERILGEIIAKGWEISNLFQEYRLCSKGLLSVADAVKELSSKFNKVRVVAQ